jgi:hypothetical protein
MTKHAHRLRCLFHVLCLGSVQHFWAWWELLFFWRRPWWEMVHGNEDDFKH